MTLYVLNQAFLAKITIIKDFPCRGEQVRTNISGLDARGGRKLRTDTHTNARMHTHTHTHTHTHGTTTVTVAARMREGCKVSF